MDVIDDLALERQVCFALYSASRATTAAYRPMLEGLGLTYPQYLVMLVLWERDGRGVHEICQALDLDTGTLSPLLKRLEKLGLIERTRRTDDERRVEIRLTPDGKSLREKAAPIPSTLACATGLSPEEHVQLGALLGRLTRSLRDTPHPTPTHREETA